MADIAGLKVHDSDNVAVIFAEDARSGMRVQVRDKKGSLQQLVLLSDTPYGHKVAVRDIHEGQPIVKYGEEIGIATREIPAGEYVHIHNLDSQRGRGDLE